MCLQFVAEGLQVCPPVALRRLVLLSTQNRFLSHSVSLFYHLLNTKLCHMILVTCSIYCTYGITVFLSSTKCFSSGKEKVGPGQRPSVCQHHSAIHRPSTTFYTCSPQRYKHPSNLTADAHQLCMRMTSSHQIHEYLDPGSSIVLTDVLCRQQLTIFCFHEGFLL